MPVPVLTIAAFAEKIISTLTQLKINEQAFGKLQNVLKSTIAALNKTGSSFENHQSNKTAQTCAKQLDEIHDTLKEIDAFLTKMLRSKKAKKALHINQYKATAEQLRDQLDFQLTLLQQILLADISRRVDSLVKQEDFRQLQGSILTLVHAVEQLSQPGANTKLINRQVYQKLQQTTSDPHIYDKLNRYQLEATRENPDLRLYEKISYDTADGSLEIEDEAYGNIHIDPSLHKPSPANNAHPVTEGYIEVAGGANTAGETFDGFEENPTHHTPPKQQGQTASHPCPTYAMLRIILCAGIALSCYVGAIVLLTSKRSNTSNNDTSDETHLQANTSSQNRLKRDLSAGAARFVEQLEGSSTLLSGHFRDLSYNDMLAITSAFKKKSNLQSIYFQTGEFTSESIVLFADALKTTKSKIRLIHISSTPFDDAGITIIAESIAHHPIEKIIFSICQITPNGAMAIAKLLSNNNDPSNHIKELNLNQNPIGDTGATLIATALLKKHSNYAI